MHTCRHFSIQELVPPDIYEARGQRAWELLDPRILKAADLIRDDFGPVIINTWSTGGDFRYRGFRPHDCTVGARLSQHRYGRALDITTPQADLKTVYDAILSGKYWQITTLEALEYTGPKGYIHIDCRNNLQEGVRVVSP